MLLLPVESPVCFEDRGLGRDGDVEMTKLNTTTLIAATRYPEKMSQSIWWPRLVTWSMKVF